MVSTALRFAALPLSLLFDNQFLFNSSSLALVKIGNFNSFFFFYFFNDYIMFFFELLKILIFLL